MAACKFALIDSGEMGSTGDSEIFAMSNFGDSIENNCLSITEKWKTLPGSEIQTKAYIAGDDAKSLETLCWTRFDRNSKNF